MVFTFPSLCFSTERRGGERPWPHGGVVLLPLLGAFVSFYKIQRKSHHDVYATKAPMVVFCIISLSFKIFCARKEAIEK